ncbi:MAG: hypothetical protein MK116_05615 [Phycisphaerales bacterium]|nr:hypothetical protein [Phycisphaerales bacterium]
MKMTNWMTLPTLLITLMVMMAGPGLATADDEQATQGSPSELDQLGAALKAAVVSGNMSGEEARAIWIAAVEAERRSATEAENGDDRDNDDNMDEHKRWMQRLIPPDPKNVVMLLHPEFLPRDSRSLANRLELDNQRALLVDTIIRDYIEAFDAVSAPLPEAIERYAAAEDVREMKLALQRVESNINQQNIDMESAAQTIEEKVRDYAEQVVAKESGGKGGDNQQIDSAERAERAEARARKWTAELTEALDKVDDRLIRLRDQMQARIDQVEQVGETVTARDLVRMARALREDRAQLRQNAIEMLELVLVVSDREKEQAALDDALARLHVENGLRHARMGGEPINPWAALVDTYPGEASGTEGHLVLAAHEDTITALLQERTDAAINREIEALELMILRDELVAEAGSEDNVPMETWLEVLEPFARSWSDQVDASVNYRDAVLAMVDETTLTIAATDQETSLRYHDIAMRRGFGPETRTRWCERALRAALELEDLDEDTVPILQAVSLNTTEQLRQIRMTAIQKRMEREPELAREPVLALWGLDGTGERPFITEDWAGQEYQAHQALDDETESTLKSMLTSEQFDSLPKRPGRDRAAKGRRGGGKGRGGSANKGKGAGKSAGKGGGKGGGKGSGRSSGK